MKRSSYITLLGAVALFFSACSKPVDEHRGVEVSRSEDRPAPGEMRVVSTEPLQLMPLRELNLIARGDFRTEDLNGWFMGSPSPRGFEAPDPKGSSLTKVAGEGNVGFIVEQKWAASDTDAPLDQLFRAEVKAEGDDEFRVEVTAGGAGAIGVYKGPAAEGGAPKLVFELLTSPAENSLAVAKRYSRPLPREARGAIILAARNFGPGPERTVHWHGWRMTKTPAGQEPPAPAPAAEPAASASTQEPGAAAAYGGIEFVWCPPGSFMQGTTRPLDTVAGMVGGQEAWFSDEQPGQPRQFAEGFWMSKNEITRAQWEAVMGAAAGGDGPSDAPATGVSWTQCVEFVEKLNGAGEGEFALPTEAQWEYACRAGAETLFPFGEDPGPLPDHAWLRANVPDGAVQAAGQKKPNAWGLCDMLGNAWEWCSDAYGSYTPDSPRPLRGYRTIRGGGVDSTAMYVRPAFRCGMAEGQSHLQVGFRVVRMP